MTAYCDHSGKFLDAAREATVRLHDVTNLWTPIPTSTELELAPESRPFNNSRLSDRPIPVDLLRRSRTSAENTIFRYLGNHSPPGRTGTLGVRLITGS